MKKNLLILVIVLLVGIIVNSCSDNEKEPPICNLGEHLGIGETCNGTNCTLKDYRTAEQKVSFPKEIYRYGRESNYTAEELRDTADKIIAEFKELKDGGTDCDAIMAKIAKLCVVQAANGGYTWDGTTFGLDPDAPTDS